MTEEIQKCNKGNSSFALFFMDLDNFKFVNDSYGHTTGDKLLVHIGKSLSEILYKNMMAFRLGGDEFIVLIKDIVNREEIDIYAKNILDSLSNPTLINGNIFLIFIVAELFFILTTALVLRSY